MAEIPSALKPILSDSASATTPRITGQRYTRCFFVHETSGNDETSMSPSAASSGASPRSLICSGAGRRTATAQVETPRIITPSSTAWPPTGASRCAINAPSGIRVSSATASSARAGTVAMRASCRAVAWRRAAGSARRGRRCPRASAARCRTDGSSEQSSTWRSGLVERVVNALPHVQRTCASTYSGWMPAFMRRSLAWRARGLGGPPGISRPTALGSRPRASCRTRRAPRPGCRGRRPPSPCCRPCIWAP